MVGARLVEGVHAAADPVVVAPGEDRVDEPVAAAVRDIGLLEAEAEEVVGVVGEFEIAGQIGAGDLAGAGRVLLQDDLELRGEQRALAEDLAGLRGVLGGDEVGDGAGRAVPARFSILGPRAASTRRPTGTPALSSASR